MDLRDQMLRRRFGLGRSGIGAGLLASMALGAAGSAAGAPGGQGWQQGQGGLWSPPTAGKFAAPKGMETLQLENDPSGSGVTIGGKFFEPGRKVLLQFDPNEGVLLHGGEKLLLGLTPQDVHDPTELGTYLAGYSNEEFRHAEACQVIPVDKDEDKYATFSSAAAFKPVVVKTNDDATPAELKVQRSLTNYRVTIRRIACFIPDPAKNQALPNYDVRYVHMERCARAINMDLELDILGVNGLLTSSANWDANNVVTLTSGFQWGGASGVGADSDPIADIRLILNTSAQRISAFWMNQRVAGLFLDHPKVRDYMRANGGDAPLDEAIKAVADAEQATVDFRIRGIGTFKVVTSRVESNLAGTTTDYIMPDVMVAVTQPKGVPTNGQKIATAYNFRRKGPAGVGFYTREVRFDARGAGGTLIIVEEASIPTMTGTICGGLITGINQ